MASIEDNIKRLGGIYHPKQEKLIPMPEEEINELERSLGTRLPESYRRFLLTYGRCAFEGDTDFKALEPLQPYIDDDPQGHFVSFFGARSEGSAGLAFMADGLRDRMPETIIPIGHDGMSSKICIGIAGPQRGKIYFWDIEDEWDEEDYTSEGLPVPPDLKFQNVHLIANSFEEFLDQLYVREEE